MKAILFVAMLVVLASSMAFAQSGASALALGVFAVGDILTVTPDDGDWGTLAQGTEYTITADGQITPLDVDGNAEVSTVIDWLIEGNSGANVSISFSLPAYFSGTTDGFRIPYRVSGTSAGWAGDSFAAGDPYQPIDPRVANVVNLLSGQAMVQLGGIVSIPAGAPADDYNAQFVLTAQYTGL